MAGAPCGEPRQKLVVFDVEMGWGYRYPSWDSGVLSNERLHFQYGEAFCNT